MSNVLFKRSTDVDNIPIVDGQVIFDELNNKIYMDNGNQRLQYGGDVSLISNIDYATANNVFSALATKNIFVRQNSVVDSKNSILAATESGLPVGCLGIQSIIGNSNYSAIGNTVSSALLTLNNNIGSITNQLKANNHDIYMDYKNGKYGYNTSSSRGADTFHPFNSISLVGQYSSDTTINVSSYYASSANEFLLVPITSGNTSVASSTADTPEYTTWGLSLGFTQGTLSLSGNNLSIILPKVTGISGLTQASHHYANTLAGDKSVPCNLYYVGTIS